MRPAARALLLLAPLFAAAAAGAGREPVLSQVALPHGYYWRELYIPQLTTGPSSAAFMPSGDEIVYAMDGSLWRQKIGTEQANEITHPAAAYDHQPDASLDGHSVVFTRYDGKGFELWRHDLESGGEQALTLNGGVNLEPRISPDGRQIVFVSTGGTGHFGLKIADLTPAGLAKERFLVSPRESRIDRYYYSSHDHFINPSWSPDGTRVWFVTNTEIPWGTGKICSIAIADAAIACLDKHQLETSWAARPEVGPDGKRILFSNYSGGQWHQLWLTTTDDAAPLPLTYGDFDRRNARWSRDGKRIAYISNEGGNTSLWIQDTFGGARTPIKPTDIRRQQPAAFLLIRPVDAAGLRVAARISVLGSDGRWHAPSDRWMHGDELYDHAQFPSEVHYFHCPAEMHACHVKIPAGKATIHVENGFRRKPALIVREFAAGNTAELPITLEDNDLPPEFGKFFSADLHVHMNYGGHYRSTPETLLAQQDAEDLDVVYNLLVNKEERIPDISYFRAGGAADPASGKRMVFHAQEYHTSFWGHMGLLNLEDHYLLPDYTSYRHTALASPWPHNGAIADLAHAQGGLVGYVHVADLPIDPPKEKVLSYELPADVEHGKLDYIEVMGFSDHHITAGIWYRFLNLGYRLPAGAGTDAMANYASLRGPIGLVRVFLQTGGERTPKALTTALKGGHTFVSNSALLGLRIDGKQPGDVLPRAGRFPVRLAMRSPVPMDHLELVQNGRVIKAFKLAGDRTRFDWRGDVDLKGGWVLLRAFNDRAHPWVLDLYPYATTSPIYVDALAPAAPEDAAYFAAWMDRVIEAANARGGWNSEQEKSDTLAYLEEARAKFRTLATKKGIASP
ncbi:MAG TPA: CehA/McbA family metallohydrolase [Steroidobacteraceae bacterium]|nr:CehA/McbA family metallohydrolase [Steroidobacteraceae bacterium]